MKLTITLELDNASFTDEGTEEVRRILDGLCDRLPEPLSETVAPLNLRDINGNWVGEARIT